MSSSDRAAGERISEAEQRLALVLLLRDHVERLPVKRRVVVLKRELAERASLFPDDTEPALLRSLVAQVEDGMPVKVALIKAEHAAREALEGRKA